MAKKTATAYAVWSTAWGPIGATATDAGVCGLVLPHYPPDQLGDLLAWENPGAARDTAPFERLVELSREYFNARPADFADIACDLPSERSFAGKVLRACRDVPYGETVSYSELARGIGRPEAARAVAAALGKNPLPLVVPCHRVTYADGRVGGFSAPGGVEVKQRMLAMEAG